MYKAVLLSLLLAVPAFAQEANPQFVPTPEINAANIQEVVKAINVNIENLKRLNARLDETSRILARLAFIQDQLAETKELAKLYDEAEKAWDKEYSVVTQQKKAIEDMSGQLQAKDEEIAALKAKLAETETEKE